MIEQFEAVSVELTYRDTRFVMSMDASIELPSSGGWREHRASEVEQPMPVGGMARA